MSKLKFFSNIHSVENKRIIVRLDLNVPMENSEIKDDTRIEVIKPLLDKLKDSGAKVILISHLGRPKGEVSPNLSLKPIFDYFKRKCNYNISFYQNKIDDEAVAFTKKLKSKDFVLFENIRFFKEEEANDENFAKNLAKLGDLFINEAFSCSHRMQASIHKITKFIDSYGGPLLEKELKSIDLLSKNKKKPVTCIIGGSKISTKINILTSLIKNSENLIVVGAMANNFIKFKNINVGKSLIENGVEKILKNIIDLSERNNCKIIIPLDVNSSTDLNGTPIRKDVHDIGSKEMILDIGEKTIGLINKIVDDSKTVFWNGPAGYYENENFSEGTISIARKIAKNTKTKSLVSIIGGGDTLAAIKNTGLQNSFTHLSTAGGAFLESLEGKELPGIKVLRKN